MVISIFFATNFYKGLIGLAFAVLMTLIMTFMLTAQA